MTRRVDKPDTASDIELRDLLDTSPLRSFVMFSGAGSGKTTSLVKALHHLARTRGEELRRRSQRLACVTYTEVAAREILTDVQDSAILRVSTIHSFLWSVIKPFQQDIATWAISRAKEKLKNELEKQAGFGPRIQEKTRQETAAKIARYTSGLQQSGRVSGYYYGIGSNYGKGILGHDDIIKMVPRLIRERPLLAQIIAREFPFILVDESQDTHPDVVEALKEIVRRSPGKVCLGFFGDSMQKIYPEGIGNIGLEDGWVKIMKPENFRSPRRILELINDVRLGADPLVQTSGLRGDELREGTVRFFVLPADGARIANLQLVRSWLAAHEGSPDWTVDAVGSTVKVLVIAHRMAARRLGFEQLYEAFHAKGSRLKDAFDEGTAWPLTPFAQAIVPMVDAFEGKDPSLMGLLRAHSPVFRAAMDPATMTSALKTLRIGAEKLSKVFASGGTIGQTLEIAIEFGLTEVDSRWLRYLAHAEVASADPLPDELVAVLDGCVACDVAELRHYFRYVDHGSPYATHQGVKGAEFPRVVVVLDDDEGGHPFFSYGKLFAMKALSDADIRNKAEGRETMTDRTRRLLYVCCSRATASLAIVLYAHDVDAGVNALKTSDIPRPGEVLTLLDLEVESDLGELTSLVVGGLPPTPPGALF